MDNWTPAARHILNEYLEDNKNRIAAYGGDAEEIAGDLRRHVEAEIARMKLPVVTEQDVQQVLQKVGPLSNTDQNAPTAPKISVSSVMSSSGRVFLFIFGFLLPIITLGFELVTHICAETFFDPTPTWFHVALIAIVPAANLMAWKRLKGNLAVGRGLWLANGVAFGIGAYYALLFAPLTPMAVPGVVFFGIGFLPLSPLLAMICTLRLRSHLRKRGAPETLSGGKWWSVSAVGLITILLLAVPEAVTRHWIIKAASGSQDEKVSAIKALRRFGDNDLLLRQCYGQNSRVWIDVFSGQPPNSEDARKVYYQVTGQAFNSVAPPVNKYRGMGREIYEDFEWDDALGGDAVEGQIKKLSLAQSRMDGFSKPEEGWAYVEWTLEFRNDNPSVQREARAQIQLPPGGVVSRLTLWVNGEEREAAFGARSQVKEAYKKVAVERRRDPVLVTTSGPDRILMQCFPVPANGTMKVRLGITAPLEMKAPQSAALKLPCFVERNFRCLPTLEHNFWLESSRPVHSALKGFLADSTDGKGRVHCSLTEAELSSEKAVLWFDGVPLQNCVVSRDPHNKDLIIKQFVESTPGKLPSRVAIMLDGSRDMTPYFAQIAEAIKKLPPQTELAVWIQGDELKSIFDSSSKPQKIPANLVGDLEGRGGQDNLPGLVRAWDWAAEKRGSAILWIHATQPLLLDNSEALRQRLDWRGGDGPCVIDVPVKPGPNRVAEQLADSPTVVSLPRLGKLQDDLGRLFAIWSGERSYHYIRESIKLGSEAEGSAHVVRLWALSEVRNLIKNRHTSEAVACATTHQLVTPVSGAVVLETKAQFDEFGLNPVSAATVPNVPEPSTWILIVMAILALGLMKKLRGKLGFRM